MKAGRNKPLELWFMLLCAGFTPFAAGTCLNLLTPEYMRNCAGFGHAGVVGLTFLAAFFTIAIANGFIFLWEWTPERNLDQRLSYYAFTTILSATVVTGAMFAWYWSAHHSNGHVCHTWSP
jgi:hypothetical protein